jgi:hypothetical protein
LGLNFHAAEKLWTAKTTGKKFGRIIDGVVLWKNKIDLGGNV